MRFKRGDIVKYDGGNEIISLPILGTSVDDGGFPCYEVYISDEKTEWVVGALDGRVRSDLVDRYFSINKEAMRRVVLDDILSDD